MCVRSRYLALHEFWTENTATSAASNICVVYGEGVLSSRAESGLIDP